MTQKLYVHIGLHKTGSTFIQNFCTANRDLLASQGICYPRSATKWKGHHVLAWSFGIKHPHYSEADGSTEELTNAIKQEADGSDILISSEDFEFMGPLEMKALRQNFQGFEIKIISYLRRQDSYLESTYAQHVRMENIRFSGDIRDFYMKFDFMQRYNYLSLLRIWESHFDDKAIVARPYQRSQFKNGSLLKDFCDTTAIHLNTEFLLPPKEDANISLSSDILAALSQINKIEINSEDRAEIIRILAKYSRTDAPNNLTPRNAADFQALFNLTNKRVAARFMGRVDGQLFADDEPSESR